MKQLGTRRELLQLGCLTAIGLLAGCMTPPRTDTKAVHQFWSGRLALQLQDEDVLNRNPQQSFSASFELRGNIQTGSLQLFTPLGSSLALIRWLPGSATLQQGQEQRSSPSLDELVRATLGTSIPIQALFAWLQGQEHLEQGWSVDLSRYTDGRIAATRHSPSPVANLRLILDR